MKKFFLIMVCALGLFAVGMLAACGVKATSKSNIESLLNNGGTGKIESMIKSEKDVNSLSEIADALISNKANDKAIVCLLYMFDNAEILKKSPDLETKVADAIISRVDLSRNWLIQRYNALKQEAIVFNGAQQTGYNVENPGIGDEVLLQTILSHWDNVFDDYGLVEIYAAAKTDSLKAAVIGAIQKNGPDESLYKELCAHKQTWSPELVAVFGKPAIEYIAQYKQNDRSFYLDELCKQPLFDMAKETLQLMLESSDTSSSYMALASLSKSDVPSATAMVSSHVKSLQDASQRLMALMGITADARHIPLYTTLLADSDAMVRCTAFTLLVKTDGTNAASHVKSYLGNTANLDLLFKSGRVKVLGTFEGTNEKGVLDDAIANGSDEIKAALLNVIEKYKMTVEQKIDLLSAMTDQWTDKNTSDAAESVCKSANKEKPTIKLKAAELLIKIGKGSYSDLIPFLRSSVAECRVGAVRYLLKNGGQNGLGLVYDNQQYLKEDYVALFQSYKELGENFFTRHLQLYGSKAMAEAYLNSGNPTLSSIAEKWAKEHGYDIVHTPY